MGKKLIIIAALISYSIYGWQGLVTYKTYTYNKTSKNGSSNVVWTIHPKEDQVITKAREKEGITVIKTTPNLDLQSYAFKTKDSKTSYLMSRTQGTILAKGTVRGRFINRRYDIGKAPWIQDFTFGLKPFVVSKNKEIKFYILNPKDFSYHKMIARKEGVENLVIDDQTYKAQRIIITLPGFQGMFWKAKAWMEEKSGDLIMYKANEGPNTPDVVTTISSRL